MKTSLKLIRGKSGQSPESILMSVFYSFDARAVEHVSKAFQFIQVFPIYGRGRFDAKLVFYGNFSQCSDERKVFSQPADVGRVLRIGSWRFPRMSDGAAT